MSALRDALPQYVALRRALGTKLREPARTLEHFLEFLEREGAEFITSELALRWAMEPQGVQRATWARRLGMVRRFATWFSTIDARTQVPPHRLLAPRRRRNKPHIFTEQEIARLMAEAARLASPTGLRALTYTTLIGLLTSTGLRPGEALALGRSDVDLENGILAIRQTKFGKSRFVPVSDSTRAALQEYASRRRRRKRNAKAHYLSRTRRCRPHLRAPEITVWRPYTRSSNMCPSANRWAETSGLPPLFCDAQTHRVVSTVAANLFEIVKELPQEGCVEIRDG